MSWLVECLCVHAEVHAYFISLYIPFRLSCVGCVGTKDMHLVHLSMLDALWKFELPSSSVPPPTSSSSSTATRTMHRKRFFKWREEVKKRNSAVCQTPTDRQTHLAYAVDRQLFVHRTALYFISLSSFFSPHFFIIILFIIILLSNPYIFESCALKSSHSRRAQKTSWFIDMCLLWVIGITYLSMSRATRDAISACKLTSVR